MATVYPDALDSDLEIPRVDQNVSEISGDAINSIRDAIFAIQRTVGLSVQGNKASLADRVNVSIDANGLIKRDALTGIGLITLPITDTQVGINAGVQEVKLALDHTTSSLFALIQSLRTDFDGISSGVSSSTAAFNLHILGQANFHDGYHIKINVGSTTGVAGMEATTVGDAINEIGSRLLSGNGSTITPHIDLNLPSTVKHIAAELSVSTTNFTTIDQTVTTIQGALDSIDASQGALGISHIDDFHSNGILKNINSGTMFNSRRKLLGPTGAVAYTEATSIIQIPGVTSFSSLDVAAGDILQIVSQTGIQDAGTYQIRAFGPIVSANTLGDLPVLAVDELAIFHTFVESRAAGDLVSVNVYKPASVSSELAPLACAVRNNETVVDTISILPPNAARVVSLGFNGTVFNEDGYELAIRAGVGSGITRDLIIPSLHLERLQTNQASPVNSQSVAERINAFVSHPDLGHNFPITAYRIGNELAIAHNLTGTNFTLEIIDGYTGNFPLGLDAYGANVVGSIIVGNDNNIYTVNGRSLSSVRTAVDGYGRIDATTSTFIVYDNTTKQALNPLRFGVGPGSVMHVTGHPTLDTNGSYTLFSANSTTVSLFSAETINAPSTGTMFNVKFTDANISLDVLESTEIEQGLVQILIDSDGQTLLHQKLQYGTNLGSAIELINVSSNFPVGDVTLVVGLDSDLATFNIIDDTVSGTTAIIHEDFKGTFKLFHSNNIEFLTVRVIPGIIPGGIEVVTVNESLVADEAMKLCTAHFNGTLSITSLIDNRQFGGLSSDEANNSFIEVFSQTPVKDLRSNGVARGFDVLDIPFFDTTLNMEALPLQGGIAYVDGVRIPVETQKVTVPSHDEEGSILNNATRIIGINEFGSIQIFSDDLGEFLVDGYNASAAFGKVLPLYQIRIINGGISSFTDLRLFINNIDDKVEIIVDESNNVVGNFRSLEGALLYAERYPGNERLTIRILNTVSPQERMTVPEGVSIRGYSPLGGEGKHRILNTNALGGSFITLSGSNVLENVTIESSVVSLGGPLVSVAGSNVTVDNCMFKFGDTISSNSNDIAVEITSNASSSIRVTNNLINNVFSGIVSLSGSEDLLIHNNTITNLSGTGGLSEGIKVSTLVRSVDTVRITNNIIKIPSVVQPTDIRGISVDVRENISVLRIDSNSVVHEAENTVTNGIRVASELSPSGTGNKVGNLFVTGNYITGVKLDDNNVFGMYFDDITDAEITNNSVFRCGVSGASRTGTAMIFFGTRVTASKVDGNVLKNGDVLRGIEFSNSSGRVNITNNVLRGLGTEAHYIRGAAPWSTISGNTLVGPGEIGIRWTGARTKISDNHLSAETIATYAFELYGIYVQVSDVDIHGNTISDMRFATSSIGISNISSASDRVRITDNTISTDKIFKMLDLYGNDHVVSNNKFFNVSKQTSPDQIAIGLQLNAVTRTLVSGNSFGGEVSVAIFSNSTTVSDLTIVNNNVHATSILSGSIILADASGSIVNTCFVAGNRFPDGDVSGNVIGVTPSKDVRNTNILGLNVGLTDSISLPPASGVSGFETHGNINGTDGYAGVSHWTMKDANSYWEINRDEFTGTRYLYFPIMGLPNGAKLNSVNIQGKTVLGDTAITAKVYRKSVKSAGLPTILIGGAVTLPTGEYGNTAGGSLVTISTAYEMNIINYAESSYYIELTHAQSTPTSPTEIKIHGVTINFTY